jgi:hypothetical protein
MSTTTVIEIISTKIIHIIIEKFRQSLIVFVYNDIVSPGIFINGLVIICL